MDIQKRVCRTLPILVLTVLVSACANLKVAKKDVAANAKQADSIRTVAEAEAKNDTDGNDENGEKGTREFAGLRFSAGLSLTIDTGDHDRVDEAKVVNNIVRVTKERNDIPRIMFESHYLFTPPTSLSFFGLHGDTFRVESGNWGHGPFAAIQPGTENIIEAISFGWMLGLRRKVSKTNSWNIGIGAVVDPDVKILGDGIEENQPLPAGETEVRLKETSQWGILILTSFSF